MNADTMNVALPEGLADFVLQQVEEGPYSSPSEYVQELVRADQQRKAQEKLESLLQEGLDSGPSRPMTANDWAELKRRVWQRQEDKKRG